MIHTNETSSPASLEAEATTEAEVAIDESVSSEATRFAMVPRAFIHEDACMSCGVCAHLCSFGAIEFNRETRKYFVHRDLCAGCSVCISVCPTEAIVMAGDVM